MDKDALLTMDAISRRPIVSNWQAQFNRPKEPAKPKAGGLKGALLNFLPTVLGGVGAVAGSVVAPIAGTAGGGALGAGLGEYLRQKLSGEADDGIDRGNIVQEGILGAVPGVFKGVKAYKTAKAAKGAQGAILAAENVDEAAALAKTANRMPQTTEAAMQARKGMVGKAGDSLRAGVVNPKVAPSPFGATKEASIVSSLEKEGLKGSAKRQYSQLAPKMQSISDELDTVLASNTKTLPSSTIKSSIKQVANESPYFMGSDKTHVKELDGLVTKYFGKTGGKMTAVEIAAAKKDLASKMAPVFTKIEKGGDLTAKQAAQHAVWESLDNAITTIAPEAKELTLRQSALFAAAPGLKTASTKTFGIPLLGMKSQKAEQVLQAGRDLSGRVLQTADGVLPGGASSGFRPFMGPAGAVAKATAKQAGTRVGASMFGVPFVGSQPQPASEPEDYEAMLSGGSERMPQSTATVDDSPFAASNVESSIKQIIANGGKDKDIMEYLNMVKLMQSLNPEPEPLNSTAAGVVTDLQNGIANIEQLSEEYASSGANNPVTGWLRSKNPFDTEAKSIQADTARVKQVIGKALEGGVLRKEDEVKYAKILPTINDTDEVAQRKIAAITSDLRRKLALYQSNLGGGGGGVDVSSLSATNSYE